MNAGAAPSYTFQAPPRALSGAGASRKKFRDPPAKTDNVKNIMHDKRVVRGNTYAAQIETASQAEQIALENERRKKTQGVGIGTRRNIQQDPPAGRSRTPEPVSGRQHMQIQTDNYLEELTDKPQEEEVGVQTDPVMDRPMPVMFVPEPSGESKETQVEEGELFDFDMEVEPILEVLVGKTLEQALMEVVEEQELRAIRAQQELYEQRRALEIAEAQRLEAAEKRRLEEIQRRKAQEEARIEKERQLASKIAARTLAKDYLGSLQQSVFSRLEKAGLFYDPLVKEVEENFMPWLVEKVVVNLETEKSGRNFVDDLLQEALRTQLHDFHIALQKQEEEEEQRAMEAERAREEAAVAAAAAAARAAAEAAQAPPPDSSIDPDANPDDDDS
eukprot:TRINITY_DN9042_c0_g4_i12.p1 TRINITY_DN9042_c0_g4~~TRINITY_DN9042_c0_g4_i12.p1  ORF type:complete len:429 (-),score=95.88 TRINITY_DN9042_c0_g4_i12:279-1442(-)